MNWDTFIPDLIVGVITGLIVGVVLLIAQRVAEARKLRADSQFAWETFKPKLSAPAHRTWSMDLDDLLPAPSALSSVDKLASEQPLHLWKRHLKQPDPVLDSLALAQRMCHTYESIAIEVESALDVVGIQIAEDHQLSLHILKRVIRARAYGFPDSEANSTIVGMSDRDAARVGAAVDELLATPRVHEAMERYREIHDLCMELMQRFRKLLESSELTEDVLS